MVGLSGCAWLYQIEVQQGNVVTQEMVDQLRQGMSKRKVRFIMGTPLIQDVFHANRWDYVYRLDRRLQKPEQRRVTLIFQEDSLSAVEGDVSTPLREAPTEERGEESAPLL